MLSKCSNIAKQTNYLCEHSFQNLIGRNENKLKCTSSNTKTNRFKKKKEISDENLDFSHPILTHFQSEMS